MLLNGAGPSYVVCVLVVVSTGHGSTVWLSLDKCNKSHLTWLAVASHVLFGWREVSYVWVRSTHTIRVTRSTPRMRRTHHTHSSAT